jgi:hypothetical protein
MAKVGQLTIENDWLKTNFIEVFGSDWETKPGFKTVAAILAGSTSE